MRTRFLPFVLLAIAPTVRAQEALDPAGRPHAGCSIAPMPESAAAGQLWTGGTVPYVYHAAVGVPQRTAMRAAMVELENAANVRFAPRTAEPDYLVLRDAPINSSAVGRIGGPQQVLIANWNLRFVMVHELMHALGLWHEHQRPDRDQFVTVQTANVDPARLHDFQVVPTAATLGTAYDFDSVMHFAGTEASINGQPTLLVNPPNQSWQGQIGQRTHLSLGDLHGLRMLYGSAVPPTITSITPTTTRGALPDPIVADGLLFDEVVRVMVGSRQVTFTLVSPTRIRFTPPRFLDLGPVPIHVESLTGPSNVVFLQATATDPPEVAMALVLLRGGFPNSVLIMTDNVRLNILLFAFDNQPSVIPGVISLGLGSQFTTLGTILGPVVGDVRGLVNAGLPVPTTVPANVPIWFQSIVYDPLNITLPVTTSNLVMSRTL